MKFIKILVLVSALALLIPSAAIVLPEYFREPKKISVIPLMSNPWFHHSKKVSARGFLKLDFEGCHLHLDEESYRQGLLNYVWLGLDRQQMIEYKSLDLNYVVVDGTFDATLGGRSFLGVGSIQNVTQVTKIIRR
jgi:hypothetical protein